MTDSGFRGGQGHSAEDVSDLGDALFALAKWTLLLGVALGAVAALVLR